MNIPEALREIAGLYEITPEIRRTGIYFLCRDSQVLYVGQSVNAVARISEHVARGVAFDAVFFLPCPAEDLNKIERAFIRYLKPPMNRMCYTGELTDDDAAIISLITNSLAPIISKHRIEHTGRCRWTASVGKVPIGWFRSHQAAKSLMDEAIVADSEFAGGFEWLEEAVWNHLRAAQIVQPTGARS
jgi:hypothetical protein